jgi:hypothetical protein
MRCLLGVLGLLISTCATAQRLDDSLSPRQQVNIDMDWQYQRHLEQLDETALNAMISRVSQYELRLNTAAHTGKTARIYLGLPVVIRGLDDPGELRLSWTTHGIFTDGTVTPGMRSLLYEGLIDQEVMVDILDFSIEIDGRSFRNPITFEPEYDIEIISP